MALSETLVTGGFTLGAVIVTGLVTAQVNASRDRRERERAEASAQVEAEDRRRRERSDLYIRYFAALREVHNRLIALTGAVQAEQHGRDVPALRGTPAEDLAHEVLSQQAVMNRMLAEFAIFGSSPVRATAEDAYNHTVSALDAALAGTASWMDGATTAAMNFLHVAREDLGQPLHEDD